MTQECALDTEGFCDYIVLIINCLSLLFCEARRQGLLFSHSVMSHSLQPHGLQHTRLPCPSLSPRVGSNPYLLSRWCHPTVSFSAAPSLLPLIFPSIRVFSNELVLHIRCPKYWIFSFSISPSNEYSGLISFRIDLFDLLTVHLPKAVRVFNWDRKHRALTTLENIF